jgi:hypothetical protein
VDVLQETFFDIIVVYEAAVSSVRSCEWRLAHLRHNPSSSKEGSSRTDAAGTFVSSSSSSAVRLCARPCLVCTVVQGAGLTIAVRCELFQTSSTRRLPHVDMYLAIGDVHPLFSVSYRQPQVLRSSANGDVTNQSRKLIQGWKFGKKGRGKTYISRSRRLCRHCGPALLYPSIRGAPPPHGASPGYRVCRRERCSSPDAGRYTRAGGVLRLSCPRSGQAIRGQANGRGAQR